MPSCQDLVGFGIQAAARPAPARPGRGDRAAPLLALVAVAVAVAVGALAGSSAGAAVPSLLAGWRPDGRVELSWPAGTGVELETTFVLGAGAFWEPAAEVPQTVGDRAVVALDGVSAARFFRLREAAAGYLTVLDSSPANGDGGVAVTRETVFRLSGVLAPDTILTTNEVYAVAGGRRILSRPQISTDRRTVTLFLLENLPASTRVETWLDGTGMFDDSRRPADLDGDGVPGGQAVVRFDTLTTGALANTGVEGRVLASEKNADGSDLPLEGVTITVDGEEETLRAVTDAHGFFRLRPAPAGRFFVHVDGRTAQRSQWPNGAYYPFVGKAWEAVPGRTNQLAGGTGVVYLPWVQAEALRAVSETVETRVSFAPSVLATNPALAGVEIRVPANALFSDNGTRGGRVGIAPVPPDRLPEPLPPGLNLPLVITVQTDGPMNFDQPVSVRFPNLPDPVTGEKLPPGAETAIWSFNHDTGRWEIQGPARVTADGNFVEGEPGVGIRQPGWHGASGGSPGGGPGGPCGAECGGPPPGPPDCRGSMCPPYKDCSKDVLKSMQGAMELALDLVALPEELGKPWNPRGCALGFAKDLAKSGVECWLYEDFDGAECGKGFAEDGFGAGLNCIPYVGPMAKAFWDTHLWIEDLRSLSKCQGGGRSLAAGHGDGAGLSAGGAADPYLGEVFRQFDLQFETSNLTSNYLAALFRSARWTGPDTHAEALAYGRLWQALFDAADPAGPGGGTLTPAEQASLLALPRPNGASAAEVQALLDHVGWLTTTFGDLAFHRELEPAAAAWIAGLEARLATGWTTPVDGMRRGLLAYTGWQLNLLATAAASATASVGGGEGEGGGGGGGEGEGAGAQGGGATPPVPVPPPRWSALIVNLETGFQIRTDLGASQHFENVILAPRSFHMVLYVDAERNQGGAAWFQSASPGQRTLIPSALTTDLPGADSDGDGILDLAEIVVGTSPASADSDGDGIPDGTEVVNRSNPLDGEPAGLGPVAVRGGIGDAEAIATEGDLAFVGSGTGGLAIFEVANPLEPVLLSRTPFGNSKVNALAAAGGYLAVSTSLGVRILRVADGRTPLETGSVGTGVTPKTLAAAGRWVYAPALDAGLRSLAVIEPDSLRLVRRVALPEDVTGVDQLRVDGHRLWALCARAGSWLLLSFRLAGDDLVPEGSLALPGLRVAPLESGPELAVGQGRAYVGDFVGFRVIDVTDPEAPRLLASPPTTQAAAHDLAVTGSGRLLLVSSFAGTGSLALSLYDVRADDPTIFLGSWDTPGTTRATVLHRGYALAADGPAGLAVLNFQAPDTGTLPPTLALEAVVSHPPDAQTADARFRLIAPTADDVLVREVEFYIDDVLVARSGRFPFDAAVWAPARTEARTHFVVRARASDTAGHRTWSEPITLRLLPDTTPPRLLAVRPRDGSVVPRGSASEISAEFDGEVDVDGLADGWRLTEAGADGVSGTGDDVPVPSVAVRQKRSTRMASFEIGAPLPSGRYRAVIPATVADPAGNALGNEVVWRFQIPNAGVVATLPAHGAIRLRDSVSEVSVAFDEVLSAPSATPVTVALIGPGGDGVSGNADDAPVPVGRVRVEGRTVELGLTTPLPDGLYRFRVQPGLRDVYGGEVGTNLAASFTVKGPAIWGVDRSGLWETATNWAAGVRPVAGDLVVIDRPAGDYTVTLGANASVTSLRSAEPFTINGRTLTILDAAAFAAPVTLNAGARLEGGLVDLAGGALLPSGTGGRTLAAREIRNGGLFHWQAGGLAFGTGTRFRNLPGAEFRIDKAGPPPDVSGATGPAGTTTASVENEGTLRKTGGAELVFFDYLRFVNSGLVDVARGTLELSGSITNRGSIVVAPDARLLVRRRSASGVVFVQEGAGRISGAGRVEFQIGASFDGAYEVSGATLLQAVASARFRFGAPARFGSLETTAHVTFEQGATIGPGSLVLGRTSTGEDLRLEGTGQIRVEGPIALRSTRVGGRLVFRPEIGLTVSNRLSLVGNAVWENPGLARIRPGTVVELGGDAAVENLAGAVLELADGARIDRADADPSESSRLRNRGRVVKEATPGTAQVYGRWIDEGELRVEGGVLDLRMNPAGEFRGSVDVAAGARLGISDGFTTFAAGSQVRGPGEVLISQPVNQAESPAVATIRGAFDPGGFAVSNAMVRLPLGGSFRVVNLLRAGVLEAGADIEVRQSLTTALGAAFRRAAEASERTVTVTAVGPADYDLVTLGPGIRLVQNGPALLRRGVSLAAGSSWELPASTTLRITNGNAAASITGAGALRAAGTVLKEGPGVATLGLVFTNTGAIEVRQGILRLNRQLVLAAGELRLAGGNVELDIDPVSDAPPLRLVGGLLTGTGSVTFPNDPPARQVVTNVATVIRPGASVGILRLGGTYVQEPGGVLEIEIAGPTPGTGHDQLAVEAGRLAGTLRIQLREGFVPSIGQEFRILAGTSFSGGFTAIGGAGIAADRHFELVYDRDSVRARCVAGP